VNLVSIFVVAQKELIDGLRDRRSLYTVLAMTLLGPVLITVMLSQLANQGSAASNILIPVVGAEFAPVLSQWLAQQPGVQVATGSRDATAAVRDRSEDVMLVIHRQFADDFARSRPAPVEVLYDSTRSSAQPGVNRVLSLLGRFNAEYGSLRLMARGLNPQVASPLEVRQIDIASIEQRAATLLSIVLSLVAMSIVVAGMQVATDATAGERERRSLEALLLSPVPRWQMVFGKFLAAAAISFLGMIAALSVLWIALARLSLEDLGIRISLTETKFALLVAAMAPLALLIPAIQIYLSCFAKTFKEAQSYMLILVLPIVATGALFKLHPTAGNTWMQGIPVMAQYVLGNDILSGKSVPLEALLSSLVECVAVGMLFLWLATRLLRNERVIFGR
jgi:sodium transport system permease protein